MKLFMFLVTYNYQVAVANWWYCRVLIVNKQVFEAQVRVQLEASHLLSTTLTRLIRNLYLT